MRLFWTLTAGYGWGYIGWWIRGRVETKKKGELMRFYTNLLEVHTKEAQ